MTVDLRYFVVIFLLLNTALYGVPKLLHHGAISSSLAQPTHALSRSTHYHTTDYTLHDTQPGSLSLGILPLPPRTAHNKVFSQSQEARKAGGTCNRVAVVVSGKLGFSRYTLLLCEKSTLLVSTLLDIAVPGITRVHVKFTLLCGF